MTRYTRAHSSAELWSLLESEGGIQAGDYDDALVSDLRARLELPTSMPMSEALAASQVPAERLVDVLLDVAQPYVEMWADLLALFERAAATAGAHNLDISYDFGASVGPMRLNFNLEHFRRILEVILRLKAHFDLSNATPAHFWAISEVFRRLNDDKFVLPEEEVDPQLVAFAAACRGGPWPAEIPARPKAPNAQFDRLLAEVWALAEVVLAELCRISADHRSLGEVFRGQSDHRLPSGLTLRNLWITESDYWLPTLVATAVAVCRSPAGRSWDEPVNQLATALLPLRNTDPAHTEPQRRLEEFLSLPVWKHRHELYSNWVCTQVIGALDDQGPMVHSAREEIQFFFSGTHLATFDLPRPRLHLWTEFRSPFDDPVGEGRSAAIQPDIALRADPLTARLTPLVVECKQYKKADARKFADAITDYANGHPDATVILVNYGRAKAATVLGHVAGGIRKRARVVAQLRPGSPTALEEFRLRVREALGLEARVSREGPTGLIRLRLTWGPKPRDLDLHLRIDSPVGQWTVWYSNEGRLDGPPYAQLQNDDTRGNGHEVLLIDRWLAGRYTVEVDNYSGEAPLSTSSAVVHLERPDVVYEFRCRADLQTQTWIVCWVDGRLAEVSWPDSSLVEVHPASR